MLLRCTLLLLLVAGRAVTAESPVPAETEAAPPRLELEHAAEPFPEEDLEPRDETRERRWYVFIAAVNTYPRLESERLIDDLLEPVVKLIAPGFDGYNTVGDLRDQRLIWPPHLGIGYQINDRWGVFIQGGYSAGKVRTDEDNRSIFLLPFHTDFEIKRGAAYIGLGLDFYPWKHPELKKYEGWGARLRAIRPFLGARYTWTHATYEAKVRLQLRPIPNLGIRLDDAWLVPSVNLNVGLEMPINERSALFVNGGYAFFDRQRHDFAGPTFTLGYKYFF